MTQLKISLRKIKSYLDALTEDIKLNNNKLEKITI